MWWKAATTFASGSSACTSSAEEPAAGGVKRRGPPKVSGTTVLKLNGSGTSDSVAAGGNLSCGGTLSLANISGTPLAAGNTFQLFTAGGAVSGSFTSTNLPALGNGLAWNTSQLSSGVLSVVSTSGPAFTSVVVSAGSIIASGSGGSASGTFYVFTTTNLLANWVVLSTNNYDGGGNFSVTNPITVGTPQRFYRIQQ